MSSLSRYTRIIMTFNQEILKNLTDAQRQAVTHKDGALLVLAGPGSGKTTVVTRRVAHLISQGVPPWEILALTFTNKAAGEMRERIQDQVPPETRGLRGLTMATFHSFCARLLRRYGDEAGISAQYTIYDTADQRDAMKRAIKQADLSDQNFTPASVLARISRAKNLLQTAEEYAKDAADFYEKSVARAYVAYAKIMRENSALDFDDLLLIVARLLHKNESVRNELQHRYRYLLIDEYQDTNHAQFSIAHALAAGHGNICVVGDPDQSIYGWRGADITNILEFETYFPNGIIVPLGENFRSTGHIVAAASGLIEHNEQRKPKKLFTNLENGIMPRFDSYFDEQEEAQSIAESFARLHREEGVPYREMAVLYRINALSRGLEDAFRRRRLPYVIARGTAFYERKEVKDALAYLRLIANPRDDIALRRVINTPTRGIGATTLARVDTLALDQNLSLFEALERAADVPKVSTRALKSIKKFVNMVLKWRSISGDEENTDSRGTTRLAQLVDRVIRESGLEGHYSEHASPEEQDRVENLEELVNAAAEFSPGIEWQPGQEEVTEAHAQPVPLIGALQMFLESVALVSDADAIDPERGAVTLMTLHAAKGLEFDVIAIAALEEGMLPFSRAGDTDEEVEEERRLCFVGMTRARRWLLLSRARSRRFRGSFQQTTTSRFIRELPTESVEMDDSEVEPTEFGENTLVKVGCLVHHPKHGMGRVEALTAFGMEPTVKVEFEDAGMKTLMLRYANLQCIP